MLTIRRWLTKLISKIQTAREGVEKIHKVPRMTTINLVIQIKISRHSYKCKRFYTVETLNVIGRSGSRVLGRKSENVQEHSSLVNERWRYETQTSGITMWPERSNGWIKREKKIAVAQTFTQNKRRQSKRRIFESLKSIKTKSYFIL